MRSQYVKDVDTAQFAQEVLQRSHEVPVVVDFWAEWCGPCRTLGPTLEALAAEFDGAFELVKVDVDSNQNLATQFGVQGIPYVMAFRDGRPISQFTGALPEPSVREWLGQVVPGELDILVDEARDAMLSGDSASAESLFRKALEAKPDHPDAGTGLASLLLAAGRAEEALDVLTPLGPLPEAERLRAAARVTSSQGSDVAELEARLAADPGDPRARLDLAAALAARAEYEPALDHYLVLVRERTPLKEEARKAMLDVFEVLGADHPLALAYRRQLASALF